MNVEIVKAVTKMLSDFNKYFSYLHGKTNIVEIELPKEAIMVWVKIFEGLTREERQSAIEKVYEHYSYHPTPQQFRELVKESESADALSEWIVVLDALRMSADDARDRVECLSPHARRALQTVGGLSGIGMCPEAALHKSVKEDFCLAWKLIKNSTIPHPLEAQFNHTRSVEPVIDVSSRIGAFSASFGTLSDSDG
ncbi:MAG: hypothetical protein KME46_29905 [Brasilonema angustatum HA4187-MV1]|jgi:hypothetical protein|nr:hypothetical protein [Brasilonema angustatum HA4187-MV1]